MRVPRTESRSIGITFCSQCASEYEPGWETPLLKIHLSQRKGQGPPQVQEVDATPRPLCAHFLPRAPSPRAVLGTRLPPSVSSVSAHSHPLWKRSGPISHPAPLRTGLVSLLPMGHTLQVTPRQSCLGPGRSWLKARTAPCVEWVLGEVVGVRWPSGGAALSACSDPCPKPELEKKGAKCHVHT